MSTKSIHPFPARMAPGLALDSMASLPGRSTVLDPMSGSGTVLRQAAELGHIARGFDVDPLAVLMSKVWTTPVSSEDIEIAYKELLGRAATAASWSRLSWLEGDQQTQDFISFWFSEPQRLDLMRLSASLAEMKDDPDNPCSEAAMNVLRLNLSRIIVTKKQAASLARDTSHSRPHRVSETSAFDVFTGYHRSLKAIRKRLYDEPPIGNTNISIGDARRLSDISENSVDAIITSPPYLNAIDYLRGHRLALVWLGWTTSEISSIRSSSIGAEKALSTEKVVSANSAIVAATIYLTYRQEMDTCCETGRRFR